MDSATINNSLLEVFSSVLEESAFMFTEPGDESSLEEVTDHYVMVTIGFSGPTSGKIILAVPEEIVPQITANMLGMDEDDPLVLENPHDGLKELINVVCGNLATQIMGAEVVVNLEIPETQLIEADRLEALFIDDQPMIVLIDDYPSILTARIISDQEST